jgi:ADP-ribosylglycohydrolase
MKNTKLSRGKINGLILGSLVGDALGVPVEFVPRQVLQKYPVTTMKEFGSHNQPKGT